MEDIDVFDGLGVEIELKNPEDFLKIRETLTRIGVSSRKEKKLYQSCHILHKRGKYAILHFKEFFILDGLESDISDSDIARRNKICKLLEEWERFLESGLLVRKGNRFFLSEPNGMELSNQVLVSMFKWWDEIN